MSPRFFYYITFQFKFSDFFFKKKLILAGINIAKKRLVLHNRNVVTGYVGYGNLNENDTCT